MHHKYPTRAIVLGRRSLAETNVLLILLTEHLGLVFAKAQGLRKGSSKLAHALQTLSEANVMLIRGRDGWRLAGAVLHNAHAPGLLPHVRTRAARVGELVLRLVRGETPDPLLFTVYSAFITALPRLTEERADAAEVLTALRMLSILGLDTQELHDAAGDYSDAALDMAYMDRTELIARVNRGITASGL